MFARFSQVIKIVLKGSFQPKSTVILMFLCNTVGDWYLDSRARLRPKESLTYSALYATLSPLISSGLRIVTNIHLVVETIMGFLLH